MQDEEAVGRILASYFARELAAILSQVETMKAVVAESALPSALSTVTLDHFAQCSALIGAAMTEFSPRAH